MIAGARMDVPIVGAVTRCRDILRKRESHGEDTEGSSGRRAGCGAGGLCASATPPSCSASAAGAWPRRCDAGAPSWSACGSRGCQACAPSSSACGSRGRQAGAAARRSRAGAEASSAPARGAKASAAGAHPCVGRGPMALEGRPPRVGAWCVAGSAPKQEDLCARPLGEERPRLASPARPLAVEARSTLPRQALARAASSAMARRPASTLLGSCA